MRVKRIKNMMENFLISIFSEIMNYLEIKEENFLKFVIIRSPHLWKQNGNWKLRFTVSKDGLDD